MATRYLKRLTGGKWVSGIGSVELPPETPQSTVFVYGDTRPVLTNPLAPTANDNVGWDGKTTGGTTGSASSPLAGSNPVTVPLNTTWENRVIYADVILTGSTSKLKNCIIYGGLANPFARAGLITANSGGVMERCTVYGQPLSVEYWRNGVNHRGGVLTVDRCAFYRTVDAINTDGTTQQLICKGSLFERSAFFNDDNDHADDRTRPYWTHNDAIQNKGGPMGTDQHYLGNRVEAFFDVTGVTWSGGSWGVGTASITGPGSIGMPHVALNAGYWNEWGQGTWANGIAFTNDPQKSLVEKNWVNGVNASSGMIMYTGDTAGCIFTLKGNRISLGGKPSSGGIIYIVQWPSNNTRTIGTGADANKFYTDVTVPASLRGTDVPFTSTGAKIDMDNF